ncbi:MAG: NAD(P)H-hydrate dehydratase [Prevotella conceptionensis]
MKIFTGTQIKELDKFTIENEPVASIDLMERAAKAIVRVLREEWDNRTPFVVFAGPGNNGGDALAVARLMAEAGYKVAVFLFNVNDKLSDDCATNKQRVMDCKRIKAFTEVVVDFDPPELTAETVVIDGLFGAGLNKTLTGGFASLVKYINQSPAKVVSIDLPSGLMTEDNTHNVKSHIVKANLTLTLQQKKLAMLFEDNQQFIGCLRVLDIRLSPEYIARTDAKYKVLEEADVRSRMLKRGDFVNKGLMGHALVVAGSYGMAGAAVLAGRACMRSGVGKLTICTPRRNYDVMQISLPEAILSAGKEDYFFTEPLDTEHYDAVGMGPGLGQHEDTAIALISQIRRTQCPMVIDADALNILASHKAWMQQLPQNLILTPHVGEFDRLGNGGSEGDYDRLSKALDLAQHLQAYILLKGHYSALCLPMGKVYFNPTGNAGMATAGSGDVLTGIITGLLARGYNREDACIVGMYLHGLAGDLAAKQLGKESLMAGDIVAYLPQAFEFLA